MTLQRLNTKHIKVKHKATQIRLNIINQVIKQTLTKFRPRTAPQVLCALLRQVFRTNRASRRAAPAVTITEKCDLIRLSHLG